VKENEMGGACRTNEKKRNTYRLLVGNPEGKRPLRRTRRRWWIMDLGEIDGSGMD
jgi:hypothetical protein